MVFEQPDRAAADELSLDPNRLSRPAITAVRVAFAVSGAAALVVGVLLLIVPGKTMGFAATMLGIYFMVTGATRLGLSIFGRLHGAHHRVLGILFGLLLLVSGIIIIRDATAAAATILIIVVLFAGIGWIIDGVMSIVESRNVESPGWAVVHGIICMLSGIIVLVVPGWSIVWLVIFAGVSLTVLGIAALIRAFTFGRRAKTVAAATAVTG